MYIKDLKNKKFGNLTVLYRNGSTKQSRPIWMCLCECGNIQAFRANNLVSGHTTQCTICGIKLNNKKRLGKKRKKHDISIIEQLVGMYLEGDKITHLSKKYKIGYGTLHKWIRILTAEKPQNAKLKYTSAFNSTYKRYKASAKYRNKVFKISKEDFLKITQKNCFYCNSPPMNKTVKATSIFIYNGIDRIDSDIGYVSHNLVPCCKFCNLGKCSSTKKEFEEWIARLVLFYK